jgi:NAD(P)H dehydrogenase (quinone)
VIALTGATGRLGGRVASRLVAAGLAPRLIVRDAARAPALEGCEVVTAEYGNREAVAAALRGSTTVFMVSAAEHPERLAQHRSFVDGAVEAGVRYLVYTSFVGASPVARFTLVRDHWATEEHIRGSSLRFTFLRDNLYADFFPFMIGPDGVIRGPAGDGRVAAVAQDDIADVAAAVLTEPKDHDGATYHLTGPEALTLDEVAELITEVTGRTVLYHPETLPEAYKSRASYGAPDWQVEAWVSTYTAIAAGEMADVSGDIEAIAGHPATSLADLLRRSES